MNAKNKDFADEDKGIDIEPGTPLQIEIEGIAFRFASTFIGMEAQEYLILKVPEVPREAPIRNIRTKLISGVHLVVRYLNEGSVIGFRSQLSEAIFAPHRLMFVKYPQTIEHHDLRSDKRVNCTLPAKIVIENKNYKGTMLDISKKGCQYLTRDLRETILLSLKKDDQISLQCQFPGVKEELVVPGKVKNIKKTARELSLGIQFQQMKPDVKGIIDQYIFTIQEFF